MTKEIKGLNSGEVIKSREKYGSNAIKKEKRKGFFGKFLENLNDPIIKVLIFAVLLELIFTFKNCNFLEIFGIIAAIILATTVSTLSELGSEKAFLKLKEDELDNKVRALRDGKITEILPSEVVVGDIIYVERGEKIQADGVVISGKVKLDQSALNGESREITKSADKKDSTFDLSSKDKLFRGSVVVDGECIYKVLRVGKESYFGMIAKDIQSETRISPLKLRLKKLAGDISKVGYVLAALVSFAYLFNSLVVDNGFVYNRILASFKDTKFIFGILLHALTLFITVVVVAAPEGLPMMVTVVLSRNMKRMLKDGVLVKKLVGIETAGSMNILFTDKTGTITTGILECDKVITAESEYKTLGAIKKNKCLYHYLSLNSEYNTDSKLDGNQIIGGNATDKAIRKFFKEGAEYNAEIKEKIPFKSEYKFSKTVFSDGLTLIKGAPEVIFNMCAYSLSDTGEVRDFDRIKIEQEFYNNASRGERVIALAYRDKENNGVVFLALLVLRDKLRRGVKEAVAGVISAGVKIVMLTGDSKETAAGIAREAGILKSLDGTSVLTSYEINQMSDEELKKRIPEISVIARAMPQDKTRLVRLSQELDLVVGMTGDGINDAPSLKLADIGFAMESGTDIAKEAADIVILDNSFFAINRTILYGRTIFKSIRKFITFQLMMNLAASGISLLGQFFGIDSPITIIQMLWVNIIMDTLGGLAFAGEAPLEYYMKEKPKSRQEALLSRDMIRQIAFTGGYTLLLCFLFLISPRIKAYFRLGNGDIYHMTAFYALFIFSGIFNCFGTRCERLNIFSNITKNKAFFVIMSLICVIQVFMIYFGGETFRAAPLLLSEILTVLIFAFSVIPFEFLRRVLQKIF